MTNLADRLKQVFVRNNQQVEEPKGSLSLSNTTLACMKRAPKPSPPIPYSFTGPFWSSRAEPSAGLQELAATRVNQLWLLVHRLRDHRHRQEEEQPGQEAAETWQSLSSARSLAVLRAITPEHPAIPKSINNFYAAQGTLPHLIKVSSHSYGFISP